MAISAVSAIGKYFGDDSAHGRKVTMDEFKALSPAERTELGTACAAALGETLTAPVAKAA
jgi:hypothetical protein